MKEDAYLKVLYRKLVSGELTGEELDWLQRYFDTGDPDILADLVRRELSLTDDIAVPDPEETALLQRVRERLREQMPSSPQRGPVIRRLGWKAVAAALLVCLLTAGWYMMRDRFAGDERAVVQVHDIPPGRQAATLTLSDGRQITLADVEEGVVAKEGGKSITKLASGRLIYDTHGTTADDTGWNTLSTAAGETYQVRLPDGTLVVLNASSSIRYTASIDRQRERRVAVTGEAYFDVAHNPQRPFVVITDEQTVRVLGTQFNIQAYADESVTRTTLLKGAVTVTGPETDRPLRPGQQAILSSDGITVVEVEAEDAVAWKDGYFMFASETLESIMLRLSRWYNVEVVYDNPELKKETFFGSISRYENISKVLQLLERTDVATFQVEENRVTIAKKQRLNPN